jgi:hypothetical protein
MAQQLCIVTIRGVNGSRYSTTVMASSTHDATRQAAKRFRDPWWKGPKPTPATMYEIKLAYGDGRVWYVRGSALTGYGLPTAQ